MRKKRKLFGVLLIIAALLLMQLPSSEAAAATTASEFLVDKDGVLTKYSGTASSVVIPSGVIAIGTDAFKNNHTVTSVVIPDSVTSIQPYAFWDCSNLAGVSIGTGIKEIGDFAFANCKGLVSVTIPSWVESIGIYSFQDCVNMTDITIPYQVHSIHESAFAGCYRLVIHADEGTYAYEYAKDFYRRTQKERQEYEDAMNSYGIATGDGTVVIDTSDGTTDGTEEIQPENQQDKSELEKYFDSITSGDGTYSGNVAGYSFGDGNTLSTTHVVANQAVMFMDNSAGTVYSAAHPYVSEEENASEPDSAAGDAVEEITGIPKYTIVDERVVADRAYYGSDRVSLVSLAEGIEEIGELSFARSNVEKLTLPNTVARISYGAFYHCDALSDVTLPESIMLVEPNAFGHTPWVENFLAQGAATAELSFAGSGTMSQNGALTVSNGDFLVSGGVLVAYRGTTAQVRIPDGVRVIAAGAFEGHAEMVSVVCPDSLVSIGEDAFDGCTNLMSVSFGSGSKLTSVLDRAFADCPIVTVTLPKGVNSIGLQSFHPNTEVIFQGEAPQETHENSAERLSNGSYREKTQSLTGDMIQEETSDSNYLSDLESDLVSVSGVAGVYASLEGAEQEYYLSVQEIAQSDLLEQGLKRSEKYLSDVKYRDALIYDMKLTDQSGIPISKLGRQALTVAIPLPDQYLGKELSVLTVDRNGQLEEIIPEIISVEKAKYIRFSTYHLSPFGIYVKGEGAAEYLILEQQVALSAMMPQFAETGNVSMSVLENWLYMKRFRLPLAIAMISCGFILILWKKKTY